jgi:hypothetical protein
VKIADLRDLCERYVPGESRHKRSTSAFGHAPFGQEWWYAHEIGHLLTVPPDHIGLPMFGLEDPDDVDFGEHELRCRELAAMAVSRRLLTAIGRRDLWLNEQNGTDTHTLYWDRRGRVEEILREHRCLRLPRTRRGLAQKIRGVLRAATKAAKTTNDAPGTT